MSENNHVIGLWNQCLDFVRDNLDAAPYKTWFLPIVPLSFKNKTLVLQVPSQGFMEILEERFLDLLSKAIYKVMGEGTQLVYKPKVIANPKVEIVIPSDPHAGQPQPPVRTKNIPQVPVPDLDPQLHKGYNFDTFIEGDSNKLPRSIGESIAMNPARSDFNPLFIYGPSGVGKTHLANAIGAKIKELYPAKRVLYVSAHLFQVQYTDSVRNNTSNDFFNFYQTIDVLIIDDIQEFAGLTKTQNTFFHIFNHLRQNGKRIILISDRAPKAMQGMEERLLTRFKAGLTAELERPTIELRKKILNDKIRRDGVRLPADVISYIAENVADNVRELEGIVASILAHATVFNREVDMELARRVVSRAVNSVERPITMDDILDTLCKHYGIELAAVLSKTRKQSIAQVRQIAMYLAKEYTDLSAARIGTLLGGRDHSTVLYACSVVKKEKEVNKELAGALSEIVSTLKRPLAAR